MRRMSSAAAEQLDPSELIARVTAEHDSPSGRTGSTGRHRVSSHSRPPAEPTGATPPIDVPGPRSGAHRVPDDDSLVEIDREVTGRRTRFRRLAPLGIGAAAVLAATLVFTLLQPGTETPGLSAALASDSSRRAVSDGAAIPGGSADGGQTLSNVASGAGDQVGAARAAQAAAAKRKAAEQQSSAGTAAAGSDAAPAARRAGPTAGAAQVAGDGVQAARSLGWGAATGDEFAGNALGGKWSAYNGAGHAGNGRRTSDAVSVENGNLVIRGDSAGNTGGIAWGEDQQYGKWEMRAKFPKGDKQYHPVLLLWPAQGDGSHGEIDFSETNSAADDTNFFLHYGGGAQKSATKALDITQWHNYAVEWTPDGIRGFIDGVQWFESTDQGTQPSGPVHPTIQLDYFPDGGSPQPSELQVAWMRQYK